MDKEVQLDKMQTLLHEATKKNKETPVPTSVRSIKSKMEIH